MPLSAGINATCGWEDNRNKDMKQNIAGVFSPSELEMEYRLKNGRGTMQPPKHSGCLFTWTLTSGYN